MEAAKEIEGGGKTARVVSMVCWELFEEQDDAYKQSVLPPDVTARVRAEHKSNSRSGSTLLPGASPCRNACMGPGLRASSCMARAVVLAPLMNETQRSRLCLTECQPDLVVMINEGSNTLDIKRSKCCGSNWTEL